MRKLFGVIAISAAALAATSAFPENVVWEHKAELERSWDNSRARAASPDDFLGRIFSQIEFGFVDPGLAEVGSDYGQDLHRATRKSAWSGNFHGGRVHPPSGH